MLCQMVADNNELEVAKLLSQAPESALVIESGPVVHLAETIKYISPFQYAYAKVENKMFWMLSQALLEAGYLQEMEAQMKHVQTLRETEMLRVEKLPLGYNAIIGYCKEHPQYYRSEVETAEADRLFNGSGINYKYIPGGMLRRLCDSQSVNADYPTAEVTQEEAVRCAIAYAKEAPRPGSIHTDTIFHWKKNVVGFVECMASSELGSMASIYKYMVWRLEGIGRIGSCTWIWPGGGREERSTIMNRGLSADIVANRYLVKEVVGQIKNQKSQLCDIDWRPVMSL